MTDQRIKSETVCLRIQLPKIHYFRQLYTQKGHVYSVNRQLTVKSETNTCLRQRRPKVHSHASQALHACTLMYICMYVPSRNLERITT